MSTPTDDRQTYRHLEWRNSRWHCDGKPIHAGTGMEIRGPIGWTPVRVEVRDSGRILLAFYYVDGLAFVRRVEELDRLRWPEGKDGR